MSGFPEQLYRKSLRDQLVVGLEPFFVRPPPVTSVNAVEEIVLALPFDRALMLYTVCAALSAGAARTLNFLELFVVTAGSQVVFLDGFPKEAGVPGPSAGTHFLRSEYHGMLLRPGMSINCRATYSAGAAANTTSFNVGGVLIPRANISAI